MKIPDIFFFLLVLGYSHPSNEGREEKEQYKFVSRGLHNGERKKVFVSLKLVPYMFKKRRVKGSRVMFPVTDVLLLESKFD